MGALAAVSLSTASAQAARCFGRALVHGGTDAEAVVGTVAGERRHRVWALVEQGADLGSIINGAVG